MWRAHRRLALARAPLAARLEVMRRIGMADAEEPCWDEDIVNFEKARIHELKSETDAAVKQGLAGRLAALADEVHNTRWRVGLPDQLLALIEDSAQRTSEQAPPDSGRSCPGSAKRAGRLGHRSRRELALDGKTKRREYALNSSDPLCEQASTVFRWLEERDRQQSAELRRRASLEELEAALGGRVSRAELERLYRSVLSVDWRGLPESIEQQYQAKMKAMNTAARRRGKIVAAVVVLGMALLTALYGCGWSARPWTGG